MSLTGFCVNKVVKLPKITEFNRFLFVGPHPDDIEIGAGALVSKLVKSGKKVSFVICTDGRFGTENCSGISEEELIERRKKEAIASAEILGVTDVRFLGMGDAGRYKKNELETALAKAFGEINPEVIFAPDPGVRNECHKDHLNVGEAVRNVGFFSDFENVMGTFGAKAIDFKAICYYMTDRPNQYVKVDKNDFEKQLKSVFDCHLTQYPANSEASKALETYLKIRSFDFGIKKFSLHGEGFRVIDKIRMHCLPEG